MVKFAEISNLVLGLSKSLEFIIIVSFVYLSKTKEYFPSLSFNNLDIGHFKVCT